MGKFNQQLQSLQRVSAIDRVCRQGNSLSDAIGKSGGNQRSRCIQQHHIAPARSLALQNRENDSRILPGIRPRQLRERRSL